MAHPSTLVFATMVVAAAACCCGPLDGLAPSGAPDAATPPPGETRFVVSATTLKIRGAPDASAPELASVPRGGEVVVTGASQGGERIVGISGGWAPVWWNGTQGYAFDGYLLSVAPPPVPCAGLSAWADSIGHAGTEAVVSRRTCAELGIDVEGDCDTRYRTPLQGGGWFERQQGFEWGEEVLYLPGAARDAAWAAVRGCVGQSIGADGLPLPRAAGPEPRKAGGDIAEVTRVVEGARAGWEWSEGCSAWLYVETVGDDVQITEGGGC